MSTETNTPAPTAPTKKKSRKWLMWVVIAIVAVFVIVQLSSGGDAPEKAATGTAESAAPAAESAAPAAEPAKAEGRTVVYEVTGDGSAASSVTYTTMDNGELGQEQATEALLPLTKEVQVEKAGAFSVDSFSVIAMAGADATTIACKITVDGEVVAEQTSTGPYSTVTCSS